MAQKAAFLLVSFLIIGHYGYSQAHHDHTHDTRLEAGYYLVIGAYSKSNKHLAEAYAKAVTQKGYPATVDFFPKKNYHFVYLHYYNDFKTSIRNLYLYRKKAEFPDCWVYVMEHTELIDKARNEQLTGLSDMFASRFGEVDNETKNDSLQSSETNTEGERITLESNFPLTEDADSTNIEVTNKKEKVLPLYFSLFDAQTQIEVDGKIEIVNSTNQSSMGIYKGNELIKLKDPENGTGNLALISEVFGFKRQQLDFNYYEPLGQEEMEYVTNIGDTVIVNFELQRYTRGDFMVMYNVFFFKDAAIMRPESQYEINQLLDMLKTRPNLKIKIHGHTNGNAVGPILEFNPEARNYFTLDGSETTSGSAKKLSELRAETIRQYLIDNGISEKRMQTKGWGGKSMLYDKHDTQAKQNVRVEVEFLTEM